MNSLVAVRLFLIGALLLGAFGAESAELIVNGDFESGNTGFTSDYGFRADIDMQGTYSVVDDPLDCHSSAASDGDHTTGGGNTLTIDFGTVQLNSGGHSGAASPPPLPPVNRPGG